VEFFREPPGTIAARFTFGQLALIAWQMRRTHSCPATGNDHEREAVDLRTLNSVQLQQHLAQLGA